MKPGKWLLLIAAVVVWWNWNDIRYSREVQHLLTQYQAQVDMARSQGAQLAEKLNAAGRIGSH